MDRRSAWSNHAFQGSGSGSTYRSNSSEGSRTLSGDEVSEDEQPRGYSVGKVQDIPRNQHSYENSTCGLSQSFQKHPLSDEDYGSTSAGHHNILAPPVERFLNDYDEHEHFRAGGKATRDADRAAPNDSVTVPKSRHTSSDKIGGSNAMKRSKKAKTKLNGAKRKETSTMGRRETDGTGKT